MITAIFFGSSFLVIKIYFGSVVDIATVIPILLKFVIISFKFLSVIIVLHSKVNEEED